jgi:hypothetical protein
MLTKVLGLKVFMDSSDNMPRKEGWSMNELPKNDIPLEHLANLNADGAMTKFLAAPAAFVLSVAALIFLLRQVQRLRERYVVVRSQGRRED